jgi:hypothetical protein
VTYGKLAIKEHHLERMRTKVEEMRKHEGHKIHVQAGVLLAHLVTGAFFIDDNNCNVGKHLQWHNDHKNALFTVTQEWLLRSWLSANSEDRDLQIAGNKAQLIDQTNVTKVDHTPEKSYLAL